MDDQHTSTDKMGDITSVLILVVPIVLVFGAMFGLTFLIGNGMTPKNLAFGSTEKVGNISVTVGVMTD